MSNTTPTEAAPLTPAEEKRVREHWAQYERMVDHSHKLSAGERINYIDREIAPMEQRLTASVPRIFATLDAANARADVLQEVLDDKRRLARELDIAMHGEENAAKQASLCDLIGPARKMAERNRELKEAARRRDAFKEQLEEQKTTSDFLASAIVDPELLPIALARYIRELADPFDKENILRKVPLEVAAATQKVLSGELPSNCVFADLSEPPQEQL